MRIAGSLGLALFLLPSLAHAAILINEVAWMGTTANANAEWLELANTGSSAVDVSGWTLTSSSGSPSITLAGTVGAGGYFLLERTSDSSVPTVTADQVYTGALTNSGTTLTLSDMNGSVIDSVVGGTNWADIGGDNTTKDTAQRIATGWSTATPTPRAVNVGASSGDAGSGSSSSAATSTESGSSTGSMAYAPPPSPLSLDIGANVTVIAHVPTRFSAHVRDKDGAVDTMARVRWSFGDGSSVEHTVTYKTYDYVGTYLVIAEATDGTFSARDELVVTVIAPSVQIIALSSEGSIIRNDSKVRLDLSGWRLTDSLSSFQFPQGTVILPNVQVFFPSAVTGIGGATEALLTYPNGTVATRYAIIPPPVVQPSTPLPGSSLIQEVEPDARITAVNAPSAHEPEVVRAPRAEEDSEPARGAPVQVSEGPAPEGSLSAMLRSPWTLGFFGILAAAGAALMVL